MHENIPTIQSRHFVGLAPKSYIQIESERDIFRIYLSSIGGLQLLIRPDHILLIPEMNAPADSYSHTGAIQEFPMFDHTTCHMRPRGFHVGKERLAGTRLPSRPVHLPDRVL